MFFVFFSIQLSSIKEIVFYRRKIDLIDWLIACHAYNNKRSTTLSSLSTNMKQFHFLQQLSRFSGKPYKITQLNVINSFSDESVESQFCVNRFSKPMACAVQRESRRIKQYCPSFKLINPCCVIPDIKSPCMV